MGEYFLLGCPCGSKIRISTDETRKEVRCVQCGRYVKVPPLEQFLDLTTQTLISSSKENMVGKVLARRYKIESYIADGAMGWVYRGTDLSLNIPVAVKILKSHYHLYNRQEKRFVNEARITAELVHPGIVSVRNFHRSRKGGYFMIMDFCPGRSLKNVLETQKHLEIPQAMEMAKQMLEALEVAHEKGVIHRDIKPANVMIEENLGGMKVRILDFGIAKVFSQIGGFEFESLTRTGCIIGTTKYMAPEQIVKGKLGGHTDLYAVGVLLYEALSGACPFDGSREKILKAILKEPPASLRIVCARKMNKKIPWRLDCVVLKALAKEPEKRFRTAGHFLQALSLCERKKRWPTFYDAKLFLDARWAHLAQDIRKGIVLLLLPPLFLAIYWFSLPWERDRTRIEQSGSLADAGFYYEAYQALRNVQGNEWKTRRISLLGRLFWQCCEQGNIEKAKETLDFLKEETGGGNLLSLFFHEYQELQQVDEFLASKEYQKALEILDSPSPKELETNTGRLERKRWLDSFK